MERRLDGYSQYHFLQYWDMRIISISKDEVVRKDFERIEATIWDMTSRREHGRERLYIKFCGFESNHSKLYENACIRKYTRNIFNKYPFIIYLLSNFQYNRDAFINCLIQSKNSSFCETNVRKIIDGVLDYGLSVEENEIELWEYIDDIFHTNH